MTLCLCGEHVKLIVGLGNPGEDYELTPHNVGFLAVDRIANEYGVEVRNRQCRALTARAVIGSETVLLAKPETFMNLSFRWERFGFSGSGVRRGITGSSPLSVLWVRMIFCGSAWAWLRTAKWKME